MGKLNGKVSDIFGNYLGNVYVDMESGKQYDFDCDDVKDELISAINDALALRETLRLKELECQQLAQDKAELVEALSDVIDGQSSYDLIGITGLAHQRCVEIVKIPGKHQ